MKSFLASARSVSGLDRVDRDVRLLEDQWQRHGEVSLERFWHERRIAGADGRDSELSRLGALIKADLRCRFERGQDPAVAGYLVRFPDLREADSRVISLIYEEFCLLEEQGRPPDVASFCDRYPAWKESLVSQLQYHHLFSKAAGLRTASPRYPEPGEHFEEYELLSLIGKGGSSRVFLARDLSLGGKRVVLKVSLDKGQEPKTQGALDHPSIVPVNSVAFQPDRGLRGLSMPFRQGLPLDEVVKRVRPGDRPRPARCLWEVLVESTAVGALALAQEDRDSLLRDGPKGDGWNGFPVRGTYAQGVAWIGVILARALHYAHGMETFHRDVKPGNVLITIHHGPQLLDFNLAESPHSAQHAESAMIGGTLPYMAPEQIEAFLNPDLWGSVGAKADIYSLGLVLRELLTGQAPDLPDDKLPPARSMRALLDRRSGLPADVRRYIPELPHALDAIVQRCLAFDPGGRYPDGQSLADDLERFLARKPLHHVTNPSRRERLANWAARNGKSIAATALMIALGMVIGLLAAPTLRDRLKPPVELALRDAVDDINQGLFDPGIRKLEKLSADYPNELLPLIYLSRAHIERPQLPAAEALRLLRKVLESPGGDHALREFVARDPHAVKHLETMGSTWADDLSFASAYRNDKAARSSADSSQPDPDGPRRAYASTILTVLELALHHDPSAHWLLAKIAMAKEILGRYDGAYGDLTELIDQSRSSGDYRDLNRLTNWILQRSRVAIRLASSLDDSSDPLQRERALKLIRDTADELNHRAFTSSLFATGPRDTYQSSLTHFFYLRIKTEVLLTLGEVELSQGLRGDALRDFGKANSSLRDLLKYSRASANPIPVEQESALRKRVKAGLDKAQEPANGE